jgi:ABC-type branched-subunit amino acid transport system substrate-binding protein
MHRNRSRARAAAACTIAIAGGLLAAGCASTASTSSGAGGTQAGTKAAAVSGDPVKAMIISEASGPSGAFANLFTIAQAAVRAVNASGGIHGRPLEVDTCDAQSNPNQAAICARKATAGGYVALVGGVVVNSQVVDGIAEPAGLPWVSAESITAADSANPLNFPLSAGLPAQQAGAGKLASDSGCKRMVIATSNTPTAVTLVGYMERGIALGTGVKKAVGVVDMQEGSTDFSPIAAKVNSYKPDCVLEITTEATTVQFLKAAETIGSKFRLVTISGVISATDWKQLGGSGGLAQDALLASPFGATSLPAWAPYFTLVDQNGGTAKLNAYSSFAQGTWLAVGALAAELRQIQGPVTRSALAAQLKKTTNLNSLIGPEGTLFPTINFTKPWNANPQGPYEYTRSVISQKIADGTYAAGGFGTLDMSAAVQPVS